MKINLLDWLSAEAEATNNINFAGLRQPVVVETRKQRHPRQFIYYITCILFALLTSLVIVLNGADCLTNQTTDSRVHVIQKSSPSNHLLGALHKGGPLSKDLSAFKDFHHKLEVRVKENTPIGTKIADIPVVSPDHLGEFQEILWAIVPVGDKQSFTLRYDKAKNEAELFNEVLFDYESQKKAYYLHIRATTTYFKYDVYLDIFVVDENDNKPQLEDFAIVFNNYKNNFPNYPIGRVPATDADENDQLHYRVLSGNNAQFILVNETTGDIQLSPSLNSNVPHRAVLTVAASDGVNNEVVAELVLTVNLVTEMMLQNSVVLRLDGISREMFLTRKYDTFLTSMVKILGTPSSMFGIKDIIVFDVEEGQVPVIDSLQPLTASGGGNGDSLAYRPYQATSINATMQKSVNVSFSVRAEGNDVESYLSSQYIEERIYLNRVHLSQALDVQVAPFQDNLCVQEPCQNYQECQATYRFDRALKPFNDTTRNMIFRPIRAVQSFSCNCPPSFTGMKNKNECSLQINHCYSNPCLNEGKCHRHELGYTCECKPEFIGPRCEHSFVNSTCQAPINSQNQHHLFDQISSHVVGKQVATMCSGKSRCVNTNKAHYFVGKLPTGGNSLQSNSIGASNNIGGGFTCQGCPYPQWSTDLCQLKTRSFTKGSYITLPSLRRRHRFHIQLQFATMENDALLLYNGRYNDKHDFIALEIVDSYLRFSYSLGQSVTSVSLSQVPVSNGNWHKVAIDYRDRNVTLLLDDCDPVIDEALARIEGGLMRRRCSNSTYYVDQPASSNNYRMLDLSSPMQLGALPPLPTEFQISVHNTFDGCMSEIYIDHQLVDLFTPIQDVGTQIGCPEKRSFCQTQTCNGHPCEDSWGAAKCLCGDDYLGKNCEIQISQEKVRRFGGNSYLTFSPIESTIGSSWQISMHFRTINPNGLLMKISIDPEASIMLDLINGALRLSYSSATKSNSVSLNKINHLDDGEWHFVEINWSSDQAQLSVDFNPNLSIQSSDLGSISGSVIKTITIGATPPANSQRAAALSVVPMMNDQPVIGDGSVPSDFSSSAVGSSIAQEPDFSNSQAIYAPYLQNSTGSQSFVGCIYGVNVSDNLETWLNSADPSFQERNTDRGCQVADVCETNTCPLNSRCVRKGMNQKKCVCQAGFVGERCLPVCELTPCQGENSKCISAGELTATSGAFDLIAQQKPGSSQYKCECELHRSGKNCEHQLSPRCPSNWWGSPIAGSASNSSICGPCNCDESKGLDGDCDKVTGQCFCKPDHYQPVGSDYCLPCDCYGVGSLSGWCNATSGQCKCRPGVVGRRCDTCASPYAEVTLRGCEVIYDACPKTFSDGVWWEKAPLDKLVEQPCPVKTSTGTALRYCHRTDGWQKANMFDCISNTFTDLFSQYQFLEENKFPLTAPLASKIANNLKQALNETITNPTNQLYGSDMYISFRLIHHLIQHESQQTGLNLTHRQDRLYIRNIAECINYLLDPAYADNWPVIASRSPNGGAEHLLRLLETYGRVLIESQSDTFTQPFEVTTKYFTFGMDTLSADQLWDLSGKPAGNTSPAHTSPPYTFLHGPPLVRTDSLIGGDQGVSFGDSQHFNQDGASIYLDHSLTGKDASPAVVIPKYDHYLQPDEQQSDHFATKAIIPLKILKIKPPTQYSEQFPGNQLNSRWYNVNTRAKRANDESPLILPEFKVPASAVRQQPTALVAYSIYKSLGPLLPNNYDNTVQQRSSSMALKNSPVVWLTVRPANGSDFLTKNIQPKIHYMLKLAEPAGKTRLQCAVWDFSPQTLASVAGGNIASGGPNKTQGYRSKQVGKFTTRGCEVSGIHPNHKLRYKYDYVNCSCDHLGAVTVLMDNNPNYDYLSAGDESNNKDSALTIGLVFSIVILIGALFVLTCVRGHSIKSNSNSINKNLIFILILIELLILYTAISRSSLSQREYQCRLVAIFLQYFSISLFFWLFVNAIHFYRMLTELRDINHGPMKFYHVLGYAIPAFFVAIAVGLRMEQFGNYLFCWLSIHEPIIWSMFGPISLISLATIILFLLALCKSLPVKSEPSGADLLKNHMLINIIKTPLIALYWIVTVYVVNEVLWDSAYLFPVLAVLKSVALFVVLCIVDKNIRYNLYVSWLRFKGEKVPFMVDHEALNYSASSQQWIPPNMMMVDGIDNPAALGKLYPTYGHNPQVTTPGFQSSCTDIFRPDLLAGFSAASTTSRSTATGTSSSAAYQYHHSRVIEDSAGGRKSGRRGEGRHRRRHKKSHRHHRHHHHHHHHHHNHDRSQKRHRDRGDADHYDQHYEPGRRIYDYDQHDRLSSEKLNNNQTVVQDLASSHSSDEGESTLPRKSHYHHHNHQRSRSRNDNYGTKLQHETIIDDDEQKQTVPMELQASAEQVTDMQPSTSSAGANCEQTTNERANETDLQNQTFDSSMK